MGDNIIRNTLKSFLVIFLYYLIVSNVASASMELKTSNNNITNDITSIKNFSNSQTILLNSIKNTLDDIKNDNQDKWNKYVNMESEILYPKVSFPYWQVFVSQNDSNDNFLNADNNNIKVFIENLTSNKYLNYILSESNKTYISSDMKFPLSVNLNKSIASASSLQLERLNTALLLQNYKLNLQKEQDLNRISKLLNLLIVNNYKAENKKSRQLSQLISLLRDNLKTK